MVLVGVVQINCLGIWILCSSSTRLNNMQTWIILDNVSWMILKNIGTGQGATVGCLVIDCRQSWRRRMMKLMMMMITYIFGISCIVQRTVLLVFFLNFNGFCDRYIKVCN